MVRNLVTEKILMKMVVVTNLIKEVQEVVAGVTVRMMEMKHELKN